MIPYDSFLIDPFLLFACGWIAVIACARLAPLRRLRAVALLGAGTLAVFWITSLSLYADAEWTRWIWEMCGAASGRDWMINSGVFRFEYENPAPLAHVIAALLFATYPGWFVLGVLPAWRRLPHSENAGEMRWRRQPGRIETWYVTFTDTATGDGYWLHAELFSPRSGLASVYGWCARFPKGGRPRLERFGPEPSLDPAGAFLKSPSAVCGPDRLTGSAGPFSWDLKLADAERPLYTFPRWAWETECLPGAQIVYSPSLTLRGEFRDDGGTRRIENARGAFGRIYGRGHAEGWRWLHADLGGGEVLEIVAAQSRHAPLKKLGPLVFLRLKLAEGIWPASSLIPALLAFRASGDDPGRWAVTGSWRGRRITVEVAIPEERSLTVAYPDTDGSVCFCSNSETADARIVLERHDDGTWREERRWELAGTAHAETGFRK